MVSSTLVVSRRCDEGEVNKAMAEVEVGGDEGTKIFNWAS